MTRSGHQASHRPGGAQGGDKANPKPVFTDVVSFVNRYIAPATGTRLGGPVAWCPRWWEHPTAILRLTALWRAWETLRLEPAGMSAWWVGHYDAHMKALLDADRGPFYRCTKAHQAAEAAPAPLPRRPIGARPTPWSPERTPRSWNRSTTTASRPSPTPPRTYIPSSTRWPASLSAAAETIARTAARRSTKEAKAIERAATAEMADAADRAEQAKAGLTTGTASAIPATGPVTIGDLLAASHPDLAAPSSTAEAAPVTFDLDQAVTTVAPTLDAATHRTGTPPAPAEASALGPTVEVPVTIQDLLDASHPLSVQEELAAAQAAAGTVPVEAMRLLRTDLHRRGRPWLTGSSL